MELYLSDAIIEAKGGLDAATKIVDKWLKEKFCIKSCTITPVHVEDYDGEEGNNGYLFWVTDVLFN
jgi:hypothetical protein